MQTTYKRRKKANTRFNKSVPSIQSLASARMMKSDLYGLTKYEQIIEFYRENPVEAVRDILGVDLIWFQRMQLREIWAKPYCCLKWSRGSSKSFLIAVFAVIKCMLYPGISLGVIAPSFRQTGYIFDYIDELYSKSVFFRAATSGHVIRTTERNIVKFFNGSFVEGLPIGNDGAKIRGRRYEICVLDEYSYHDEQTIKLVVRPFLVVQKGRKVNQLIIASTPSYRTNHFYEQYLRHKKNSILKPELYSCTSYNFIDVIMANHDEFRIDLNYINEQFHDQTLDEFLMEYAGYFPSEGANFFPSMLITRCEPRISPVEMEFEGDPDSEYVMGVDPARSKEGDNFAITLMKLLKDSTRHITRVVTVKGVETPLLVDLIREQLFVRKFNVIKICMDYGGGGQAIADLLVQPWVKDGQIFPSIVTMDQVLDKENYDSKRVLPILEIVHFHTTLIDYMYTTFKADMEHRKILFPITIRRDPNLSIEEHGKEFAMLKAEMQHLTPRATTKGLTFEENPKLGKDRITSAVLANYAANLLYKSQLGLLTIGVNRTVPTGFWLT